ACGVCASELDMWKGLAGHATYPWHPGHEVTGTVEAVGGEVEAFAPGDAVTAWVTTRGFAEQVAVKAAYCFPIGDVPAELALGEVTRMSGTVVIAGYHQGAPRTIPLGHWNWMAFRIANAHFRDITTILRGMRIGVRLLTSGRISMEGLVSHRYPLDAIADA